MNLYATSAQSTDTRPGQATATELTLRAKANKSWALGVGQNGAASSASGTGDTVSLSDEARTLAASGRQSVRSPTETGLSASDQTGEEQGASSAEQAKERVRKRIKELQREIQKAQSDTTLTEDERNKKIQELQTELMSLMSELQRQSGGQEYKGGTQAAGFVKSLAEKYASQG